MRQALLLYQRGYRVISRKHCIVSRIDRDDWRWHMANLHYPYDIEKGLKWVRRLGEVAADVYRRMYSEDKITVPRAWLKHIPNSNQPY